MELIYLRGSPWSVPLIWSVYASKNDHLIQHWTEHKLIVGDLYLRWKSGSSAPGTTLSVPKLFDESGRLKADSSLSAAKLLCSTEIYPPEKDEEMMEWNAKCDKVRRLVRTIGLDSKDNLAELLFGRIPIITPFLGHVSTFWMKSKYGDGDLIVSKDEGVEILLEMANVIKERSYILKTSYPTYIDFSIGVLLDTIIPEYGCTISSVAPKGAKAMTEALILPKKVELEPLLQWKRKLFEEHFCTPELKEMRKRLELPGLSLESLKTRL